MTDAARALWRLWGWPVVLAVMSAVGLVGALWGGWTVLAWIGLGAPALACVWFGVRGRR